MNVLFETMREIRRLMGDEVSEAFESSYVYEVLDADSQEGVYYIIVSEDMSSVTLTSISTEGAVNQGDLMLIATRVTSVEPIVAENGYIFQGDLGTILEELIDQHAIIILNDIEESPIEDNPDALPIAIPDVLGAKDDDEDEDEVPDDDDQEPQPIQMPDQGPDQEPQPRPMR